MKFTAISDTELRLEGVVDGTENWDAVLASLKNGSGPVAFDCGGILRINSIGIKVWMRYFGEPSREELKLTLRSFPPVLVQQLNIFKGFTGRAVIESVGLPFRCPKCTETFTRVFAADALQPYRQGTGTLPCPKCGGVAEFDDIPEEFFQFL